MTRSTVPGLFVLAWALFLPACTRREVPSGRHAQARGASLFLARRCANCHGRDGKGSPEAPALAEVKLRHSQAELVALIRDASSFARSEPRLVKMQADYSQLMPGNTSLENSELEDLATFVLGL